MITFGSSFREVYVAGKNSVPVSASYVHPLIFAVVVLLYANPAYFCTFCLILVVVQCNPADGRAPGVYRDKMWRTRPLMDRIWEVNEKHWTLSRHVSIDEQTLGFQGRGEGAVRITYKNEGDGYQALIILSPIVVPTLPMKSFLLSLIACYDLIFKVLLV